MWKELAEFHVDLGGPEHRLARAFAVLVPLLLVLLIVAGDLGERPARAGDPKGAAWAALGLGRIPQTRQGTRSQRMTRRAGDKSEVLAMVSDGSGGPGEPGAASSLYMTSTRTGRSRQRGCHFSAEGMFRNCRL